jgi:outer membrane protein OmpA-like peptidoglycan-associated protein
MNYKINISLIALLAAVGCSQKPVMTEGLKNVQQEYLKLKMDEKIVNDAPLELLQAGKLYSMTKSVKSKEEADHLTYMLKNQIEVAKESAKTKELEAKILKLKEDKAKALLDEKERQLLLAQKEAEKAKLEAEATKDKLLALQELNAQQTNRGLVLTLGDVLFETGKSNLLPGSMRAIDKLAEFLADNPERVVLIEGHTDDVGSVTSNLDLSLRRSTAVQEALVAKGIDVNRLLIKGYGEAYPVASNSDAGGRQRNRRVEIVILEEGVDPNSMMRENQ